MTEPLNDSQPAPPARLTPEAKPGARSAWFESVREWFSRSQALRAARAAEGPAERRESARRARLTLELGIRAHDPTELFGVGPSAVVASELYRQAAYWALASLHGSPGEPASFEELWARADCELVSRAVGGAEGLAAFERWSKVPSFTSSGLDASAEQERAAVELARGSKALVDAASAGERGVERLKAQRLRRFALPVVVVLLLLAVVVPWWGRRSEQRGDLAAGKPWRASSEFLKCVPEERRCGNVSGLRIFFHTNEEQSPWIEFDLGKETAFSKVKIENRSDCCVERAVPLVLEVSNDRRRWKEIGRRKEVFQTWSPSVGKQKARYVRARGLGRNPLHFESFRILK